MIIKNMIVNKNKKVVKNPLLIKTIFTPWLRSYTTAKKTPGGRSWE